MPNFIASLVEMYRALFLAMEFGGAHSTFECGILKLRDTHAGRDVVIMWRENRDTVLLKYYAGKVDNLIGNGFGPVM